MLDPLSLRVITQRIKKLYAKLKHCLSGVTMQHLYTMRTARFFDGTLIIPETEESLVSVTHISLCIPARTMVVAYSSSQILIFNWGTTEVGFHSHRSIMYMPLVTPLSLIY